MKFLIVASLCFLFPFSTFATDYQGNCSVLFQGTSTLHDFEGKGRCQPFSVSETDGLMTIPELNVAVAGMDTDNAKRDKKMLGMFEADKYPLITGRTGPVEINSLRKTLQEDSGNTPEVLFNLKIRDIEKPVTAVLKNIVETDSTISADLVFSLLLPDYQLKPPSVLGIIKVGEIVDVTTSFTLTVK